MFRKPRNADSAENATTLGRPPTPPDSPAKTPFTLAVPPAVPAPKMAASKAKKPRQVPLPVIGRQGPSPSSRKAAVTPKSKQNGKPNSSILSFFKKAEDGGEDADGLFVPERSAGRNSFDPGNRSPSSAEGSVGQDRAAAEEHDRYNENGGSVKRRRAEFYEGQSGTFDDAVPAVNDNVAQEVVRPVMNRGPFMEFSDSEDEEHEQTASTLR